MSRNKYPEQTVEKIVDAAACLFAQKGYAHTTLQDVIDETGLSSASKRWAAHCRVFGTTLSFFPLSCTICWKRLFPFT